MEATVTALERRVSELEKHSHPPVNLRPAVEAIVEECLSRHIDQAHPQPGAAGVERKGDNQ